MPSTTETCQRNPRFNGQRQTIKRRETKSKLHYEINEPWFRPAGEVSRFECVCRSEDPAIIPTKRRNLSPRGSVHVLTRDRRLLGTHKLKTPAQSHTPKHRSTDAFPNDSRTVGSFIAHAWSATTPRPPRPTTTTCSPRGCGSSHRSQEFPPGTCHYAASSWGEAGVGGARQAVVRHACGP